MAELRLIREEDVPQCIRVANEVFRTVGQKGMEEAFPHLYAKGNRQSFGAFEEGRLVSFLGMAPQSVRIGEARLDVLSVGSVCTLAEARGKGYASRLFALAKAHAAHAGASLVLVSGDRPLYTEAGCHRFGSVRKYVLDGEQVRQSRDSGAGNAREWEPADLFGMAEAARARAVRYEQSAGELAALIAAGGIGRRKRMGFKALVAEGADRSIRAFAVIALPPPDQPEEPAVAVEWAGDPVLTADLWAYALRVWHLPRLLAPVNWHERTLSGHLDGLGHPYTESGNVGTVHIANAQRLFEQLGPYYREQGRAAGPLGCDRLANGDYAIGGIGDGDETLQVKPGELAAMLFDPEAGLTFDDPRRSALAARLLIPFPYTGGLNYV